MLPVDDRLDGRVRRGILNRLEAIRMQTLLAEMAIHQQGWEPRFRRYLAEIDLLAREIRERAGLDDVAVLGGGP